MWEIQEFAGQCHMDLDLEIHAEPLRHYPHKNSAEHAKALIGHHKHCSVQDWGFLLLNFCAIEVWSKRTDHRYTLQQFAYSIAVF